MATQVVAPASVWLEGSNSRSVWLGGAAVENLEIGNLERERSAIFALSSLLGSGGAILRGCRLCCLAIPSCYVGFIGGEFYFCYEKQHFSVLL